MHPRLEISLRSFEVGAIQNAIQQVRHTLPIKQDCTFHEGSMISHKKKFTLLRSPHIDKKSREQFEIKYYKKKIFVFLHMNEHQHISLNEHILSQEILLLENIKHIPFRGVQVMIRMTNDSFL